MTFRWGRTGRAAQKWLLLPEERHDPPGELRVVHYSSNMPRTRTIKVNGDVGRRVAFGSENISDTALGAGKITVAARDGEPPGLMVGRHYDQRPRRAVGKVHRRSHGTLEIAHFGQYLLRIVTIRRTAE